jgi:hypothetical protein
MLVERWAASGRQAPLPAQARRNPLCSLTASGQVLMQCMCMHMQGCLGALQGTGSGQALGLCRLPILPAWPLHTQCLPGHRHAPHWTSSHRKGSAFVALPISHGLLHGHELQMWHGCPAQTGSLHPRPTRAPRSGPLTPPSQPPGSALWARCWMSVTPHCATSWAP